MGAFASCNIGNSLDAEQSRAFDWHAMVSVHSRISTFHGIKDDEGLPHKQHTSV
jgi:hypothetical protein